MPGQSAAADYLELLQKDVYSQLGQLPDPDDDGLLAVHDAILEDFAEKHPSMDMAQLRATLKADTEKARAERPSRYERLDNYMLISGLAERIEHAAREAQLPLPSRPVFGTLPLRQFNAMAIHVPGTLEHIIAFQHGVFGFVNLLSKAVAASFPLSGDDSAYLKFSSDPADVARALDDNAEPVVRFADFLTAYVVGGDPHLAEQYLLGESHSGLAAMMLDSAELFVMGHEYAHVIRGHLHEDAEQEVEVGDGSEVEALSRGMEQELEADVLGLSLSVRELVTTKKVDVSLAFFGVYLIFSAMEVIDRAVGMLRPDVKPSSGGRDSHPPPDIRRHYLTLALAQITSTEAAEAAAALGEQVRTTLDELWQRTQPYWARLREQGVAPSPIWGV